MSSERKQHCRMGLIVELTGLSLDNSSNLVTGTRSAPYFVYLQGGSSELKHPGLLRVNGRFCKL